MTHATTIPSACTVRTVSLDEQLRAFRHNPFLTMPVTGTVVWAAIGMAGALLPQHLAVLATYVGTGMIFYLALAMARLLGEDLLGRRRKGNLFDRIFLTTIAMSCLVYALAVPFQLHEASSVPLSVGVLTGLMWLPFSAMAGHWVGYFHATARTVLLTAAWYLFPEHRFVVLPAVIVGVYLVSIVALARRWAAIRRADAL